MKKIIILHCFIFAALFASGQKQANTWYFGTKVGLNFNQLPPSPIINSALIADEGCSVISDYNGKLLFYTNGLGIINKKNLLMKNGNNLMGDLSSTDNCVIVPSPGNDSIYYLFTIGSAAQLNKGFRYNIINIKADSGFGEIINKNISVEPEAFEKLAAVRHCNNRDVWIVIRKWNTDEYLAYLVTPAGVNLTPVVSHTGLVITGQQDNAVGTLKFSSNGKYLVAAHSYGNNVFELMDFDHTTGILSNPLVFSPNPGPPQPQTVTGVYGAEFSPSGNLLYVSDNSSSDAPGTIYQFDISSHNLAIILASKQVIASPEPWFLGALQIGPDNKIYMAMAGDSSISVIENPDVYGTGCNFNYNKIFLGQNIADPVRYGLPNFIQSYFNPLSNLYDFARAGNCTDHNVSFTINRTVGIDSVKWDFGDGNQSQLQSPTNYYTNPGFYIVKLIVYKIDCSGINDTTSHRIWVTDKTDFLGVDTSTCGSTPIQLGIESIVGASYLWNTGSTANQITSSVTGIYWMEIELDGCTITDSINVQPKTPPVLNIGPDTTFCAYKPVILNAGNTATNNYLWSTGETSSSISVSKTGIYYVTVIQSNCITSDTVTVTTGDCEVFIPSAFTPNNDNKNERFGVLTEVAVQYFWMQIFNKWGQLIFNSNDISKKWDGTFKGKEMPNGAYLWMLNYVNRKGKKIYDQGTVLLIR